MANNLAADPWVLDTAGGGVLSTLLLRIRDVRWVNPVTVGDRMVIQDANGNVIIDMTCDTAKKDQSDRIDQKPPINGLNLVTLGSGKVYIYLN